MSLLGITHGADTLGPIVDSALAQYGCTVDRPAPGVWRATGHHGEPFVVTAEDGWLTIHAAASGELAAQSASTLLAGAASLPAHTKLVAAAQDTLLYRRAELPLDLDADLSTQLPALIAAFAAIEPDVAQSSPAPADDKQLASSLAERCAEAGWPAVERPDGELAVELDVPGSFVQATIRQQRDGRCCVDVPVTTGDAATDICREASARLVLRVGGLVRLVQPALIPANGAAAPGFRILLPPTTSSGALGHALAALSIACRLCAREAAVLWRNERPAHAYLERRLPETTAQQ